MPPEVAPPRVLPPEGLEADRRHRRRAGGQHRARVPHPLGAVRARDRCTLTQPVVDTRGRRTARPQRRARSPATGSCRSTACPASRRASPPRTRPEARRPRCATAIVSAHLRRQAEGRLRARPSRSRFVVLRDGRRMRFEVTPRFTVPPLPRTRRPTPSRCPGGCSSACSSAREASTSASAEAAPTLSVTGDVERHDDDRRVARQARLRQGGARRGVRRRRLLRGDAPVASSSTPCGRSACSR